MCKKAPHHNPHNQHVVDKVKKMVAGKGVSKAELELLLAVEGEQSSEDGHQEEDDEEASSECSHHHRGCADSGDDSSAPCEAHRSRCNRCACQDSGECRCKKSCDKKLKKLVIAICPKTCGVCDQVKAMDGDAMNKIFTNMLKH